MEACLEKKQQPTSEVVNVAVHPEDCNGATHKETIGATEDNPGTDVWL
jgi:hypothetical protein